MAERSFNTQDMVNDCVGNVMKTVWSGLLSDDTGQKFGAAQLSDKTVQVSGTFGGATVKIEGSNNGGSNWNTLTDPQGNLISFTAAGMETIMENVEYIRPALTGGDTTTNISVYIVAKGIL